MKSLAHPEWPYIGTPHEWRGFARKSAHEWSEQFESQAKKPKKARVDVFDLDGHKVGSVYQKQNFGPDLD